MAHQKMSRRKAHSLSFALFLIGLALVAYFKYWWPGIMLAVGIPIAVRQYLLGKIFDMIVSLVVFIGVFVTVQFQIKWDIILPVLFTIGGLYIFFKEFFGPKEDPEVEDDEDQAHEIEEDDEDKFKH
jgi:predicted membrane protein